MSPTSDLPILVGPPDLLEGSARDGWLDRVRACRHHLLRTWQRQGGCPEPAAAAVDQVLGLMLLCRFVRDRRPAALPIPEGTFAETIPQSLCQALRQEAVSPVLQAVFDEAGFDGGDPLPAGVWRTALAADLGWRDRTGRVAPLPPTAFGEFHQLCLAERDAGEAGERRARGVHYTPVSLADYLTSRVLDRLLATRDAGMPLRILDPSCGGGTFLLAALRYLLQRHADASPQETLNLVGASLFGIDIDPQAVRWARPAVLLATWDALLGAGKEAEAGLRVPDLSRTIVCRDFLDPGVTASDDLTGKFHAILGGPPFVRIHELLRSDAGRVGRYRAEYRTARSGQLDLFMPFFEEAIRRLAEGGWLGWSVSSTFLRTSSGRPLRGLLGGNCAVHELAEFEDSKVYPDAITQIVLVLLEKGQRETPCHHAWIMGQGDLRDKLAALWSGQDHPNVTVRELPDLAFRSGDWSFGTVTERSLLDRIRKAGTPLAQLSVSICQGVVTGADPVFLFRRVGSTPDGEMLVQGRGRGRHLLLESALLRPVVRNRDISGYAPVAPRTVCLTPYDAAGRLLPEEELRTRYPRAYRYLLGHRSMLARRRGVGPGAWYALRSASCLTLAAGPRVLLKLICSGGDFTMDQEGLYLGHSGTLLLVPDRRQVDPFYLLGVLNSRVFWFFVRQTMPTMGHGRHVLRRSRLRRFPLLVSDSSRDARQQVSDAVQGLLAAGQANRPRMLAEVERLVAGLYGIDPDDLWAGEPGNQGADVLDDDHEAMLRW
jgi:adenine-specific DNA-methyltransferase